jgi:cyclopropane fatty-acyl-phospholipid synthase-like methyltransferase
LANEKRNEPMREVWDARYAEPGFAYGTEANAFLQSQRHRLEPGMRALAVGDGEGRNGVWLAAQGLEVVSVDCSEVGLAKLRELAASCGVKVCTLAEDLLEWRWPHCQYDLVVSIFVHFRPDQRPRMHQSMLAAVKPGGLVLLEAFHRRQLGRDSGGPPVAEMLYTQSLLEADFAAGEILLLEEREVDLTEGAYHRGPAVVVRAVIRRPE